ncbi:winged helix-turn-helix transcriptional regulator [Streptomyces spiralis]
MSEKMLTQTLRTLEHDGLAGRTVHPEVPPHVEYGLTALGHTLREPLKALTEWSVRTSRKSSPLAGSTTTALGAPGKQRRPASDHPPGPEPRSLRALWLRRGDGGCSSG